MVRNRVVVLLLCNFSTVADLKIIGKRVIIYEMFAETKTIKINSLNKAILATVVWFDVLDYPLTVAEIARYLYWPKHTKPVATHDIENALESNYLKARLASQNGFYFLVGHNQLVTLRAQRHNITIPYWKKATKVARRLQAVPFLDSLALCNLFAFNNKKTTSDIDTFIVVRDGRIWTARFLATALTAFLGQWRHGHNVAGQLCLSFYLTDRDMSLNSIKSEPYDIYLNYWIASLGWIIEGKRNEDFMLANSWIASDMPNYFPRKEVQLRVADSRVARAIRKTGEFILDNRIGDWVESVLRKMQLKKMGITAQATQLAGQGVVVNDHMLKFHEEDRRANFRAQFEERYEALTVELKPQKTVFIERTKTTTTH